MSNIIGYLAPDLNGESVPSQIDQLNAAGANKIFREHFSGTKGDRPQLDQLLADVRDGDTVVVTSLNRIAHNTRHLLEIVESLDASGVTFKVIDHGLDTSTPDGKVIRMLLGAIADFERQKVRESQALGIAKAKREGRYKGRKPTAMAKTDAVLALNDQGLTRQKIAEEVGIGVASVYRILKNNTIPKKTLKKVQKKSVDKSKRVKRKSTREPPSEQLSLF